MDFSNLETCVETSPIENILSINPLILIRTNINTAKMIAPEIAMLRPIYHSPKRLYLSR
jgi:hypothetical protein